MYSLYRAWLGLGPCPIAPPLDLTSATTATQAGFFSATSLATSGSLLAAGSNVGYGGGGQGGAPDVVLQVGPSMTQFSAHRAVLAAQSGFFKAALSTTDTTAITVPNVNVDEFSHLLTFMYTGYLDLDLANIYNILLATHILHMPRALEICRTFLLNQTQHHHHHHQQTEQNPPAETTTTTIIKPIASRKTPQPAQQIHAPLACHSSLLNQSDEGPFKTVKNQQQQQQQPPDVVVATKPNKKAAAATPRHRDNHKSTTVGIATREKVTIDIACCDGPVRFHRVANKNYAASMCNEEENNPMSTSAIEIDERNAAMNKIMNENINHQQQKLDETTTTRGDGNGELFTCLYCKHTFKSQYCYQKHARRHLNPVVPMETKPNNKVVAVSSSKREVKLLDMNVQYYPCKTCGSKFPSYYFVHKHRKLCHADELGEGSSSGGGGNRNAAVNSGNDSGEEGEEEENSNIDVEAINN